MSQVDGFDLHYQVMSQNYSILSIIYNEKEKIWIIILYINKDQMNKTLTKVRSKAWRYDQEGNKLNRMRGYYEGYLLSSGMMRSLYYFVELLLTTTPHRKVYERIVSWHYTYSNLQTIRIVTLYYKYSTGRLFKGTEKEATTTLRQLPKEPTKDKRCRGGGYRWRWRQQL